MLQNALILREAGLSKQPRLARIITWDDDTIVDQSRYAAPAETQLSRSWLQTI
jgi:hypothetical protein